MKFPVTLLLTVALASTLSVSEETPVSGSTSLFNGETLEGWIIPEGDNGHWKVIDGVIDYDALSEADGSKDLWSEKDFGDFELTIEWRLKETQGFYNVPYVLPDGSYVKDEQGKKVTHPMPNADSGVFVRGSKTHQINIWCWPIGSGEVYGVRNNENNSIEVRAGVTPSRKADHPVGQWNTFIIKMVGHRLTVVLNDHLIIEDALLPGVPERGPIGLQHHGGKNAEGEWSPASSLVQFRNISIRELTQ